MVKMMMQGHSNAVERRRRSPPRQLLLVGGAGMVAAAVVVVMAVVLCALAPRAEAYKNVQCPGSDPDDNCHCAQTQNVTCPAGYYCPDLTAAEIQAGSSTLDKANCTVRSDGVPQCPCTPGFYCPHNTSQPQYCCRGYFCETTETIHKCKSGHYCQYGFVEGRKCNGLNSCPEGSSKQKPTGSVILSLFFLGALGLIFCCIRGHRNRRRRIQQLAMEQEIQRALDGSQRLQAEVGQMSKGDAADKASISIGDSDHDLEEDSPHLAADLMESASRDGLNARRAPDSDMSFLIEFANMGKVLKNGTVIMNNVSGRFQPGRLCAVMGPSGAGKTTIVNLVTGKVKHTAGRIFVNGQEEDGLSKYKKLMGFVPQEDIMIRELTVRDNVTFSACIRLPTSFSDKDRSDKVTATLQELGIGHVQHTIIGDERERGISGGQRKRVNIALELVTDPVVLFLDEPTSGLDSTTSSSLCHTLQRIARSRRMTVVAVIHQPSQNAFLTFDDLLLLCKGGSTVYEGPINVAEDYFRGIGFSLPPMTNPADFYLDIVNGEVARENDTDFTWEHLADYWRDFDAAREQYVKQSNGALTTMATTAEREQNGVAGNDGDATSGQAFAEAVINIPGAQVGQLAHASAFLDQEPPLKRSDTLENGELRESVRVRSVLQDNQRELEADADPAEIPKALMDTGTDMFHNTHQYLIDMGEDLSAYFSSLGKPDPIRETPGAIMQFNYCLRRALKQVFRGYRNFIMEMLLHFGCGLFISVAAQTLKYIGPQTKVVCLMSPLATYKDCGLPANDNYTQIANFMAWGIGFAGIASAAGTFGHEQVNFWRETAVGLKTLPYFFAKLIADVPRILCAAVFFDLAFATKYSNTGSTDRLYLTILMIYCFGWALGYLVSQLVSIQKASLVGVLVALIFAVGFSGSTPRLSQVIDYPIYKRLFWQISGPRWALEAFYVEQVKYYKTVPSGPLEGEPYIDLDPGLNYRGYDIDSFWYSVGNIGWCAIGWGALAVVIMKFSHRDKKV